MLAAFMPQLEWIRYFKEVDSMTIYAILKVKCYFNQEVLPQSTVVDLRKTLFDASFTAELSFVSANLCKIEHEPFR